MEEKAPDIEPGGCCRGWQHTPGGGGAGLVAINAVVGPGGRAMHHISGGLQWGNTLRGGGMSCRGATYLGGGGGVSCELPWGNKRLRKRRGGGGELQRWEHTQGGKHSGVGDCRVSSMVRVQVAVVVVGTQGGGPLWQHTLLGGGGGGNSGGWTRDK